MNALRPCIVHSKEKDVQAFFHMFYTEAQVKPPSVMVGGAPGGQLSTVFALVEYADGTVHSVYPGQIQFTDIKLKISLNNDTNKVKELRDAIKANDGYCPCELHKTPDTKCMCKAFREQRTPGQCKCGLYIKEEINNG